MSFTKTEATILDQGNLFLSQIAGMDLNPEKVLEMTRHLISELTTPQQDASLKAGVLKVLTDAWNQVECCREAIVKSGAVEAVSFVFSETDSMDLSCECLDFMHKVACFSPAECIAVGLFKFLVKKFQGLSGNARRKAAFIMLEMSKSLDDEDPHHVGVAEGILASLISLLAENNEPPTTLAIANSLWVVVHILLRSDHGLHLVYSSCLVETSLQFLKVEQHIRITQVVLMMLQECANHSTALKRQMFEFGVSRKISAVVNGFLQKDNLVGLDYSLGLVCCLAERNKWNEEDEDEDIRDSFYCDLARNFVSGFLGAGLLNIGSVQMSQRCILGMNRIMSSLNDENLASVLRDNSLFKVFPCMFTQHKEAGTIDTVLDLIDTLAQRNPDGFRGNMVREGILFLLERMKPYCEQARGLRTGYSEYSDPKFTRALSKMWSLGDTLRRELKGETQLDVATRDETVIKIMEELGKKKDPDHSQGGPTGFELLFSGVLDALVSYFTEDSGTSSNFNEQRVVSRRVCHFLKAWYEHNHGAVEEEWLPVTVRKLNEAIYFCRGLEFDFPKWWDDIFLMLTVAKKANESAVSIKMLVAVEDEGNVPIIGHPKATLIEPESFINDLLANEARQAMKQMQYSSKCLQMIRDYPFLYPLNVRKAYFKYQCYLTLDHDDEGNFYGDTHMVSRNNLLETGPAALEKHCINGGSRRLMDVYFQDEPGRGHGPTKEFFSLVSGDLQNPNNGLWRHDSTTQTGTLFPKPYQHTDPELQTTILPRFLFLGRLMAESVRAGILLDLNLSEAFCKAAFFGHEYLTICDLYSFDHQLASTWVDLNCLVNRKRKDPRLTEEELLYRGCKLQDMALAYEVPGYPEYKLRKEEEWVTLHNLQSYLEDLQEATLHSGIAQQIASFRCGFEQILPISCVQVFRLDEFVGRICGEEEGEPWTAESLKEDIDFKVDGQGFCSSEEAQKWHKSVMELLAGLSSEQKKQFLRFTTGSPRLPLGGLKSLRPRLSIVLPVCSSRTDGDNRLPWCFTCSGTLFIPVYSDTQTMAFNLIRAISEGHSAFAFR